MILAALWLSSLDTLLPPAAKIEGPQVTINQHSIKVEIADDETERVRGLSGRDSLPPDQGMLFIFPQADEHGIWMKDMRFNLDILWLDENRRIIAIVGHLESSSYPKVVKPAIPARYVLEVNAGVTEKYGWSTGQVADFQLP